MESDRVSVAVVRADARALPLPDGCADLVVTSPPYFGLRSYTDGGEHYAGQIGSEATPAAWLAALTDATREWVRVLKPGGSIFVNLGDKYASDYGGDARTTGDVRRFKQGPPRSVRRENIGHVRLKSLMGLPWRYALACVDDLGLILRAEIIWCLSGGARVYARTPTGTGMAGKPAMDVQATITGYACACPVPDAPTRPALVVDPFGGTGTTALVASMHGRHGISFDRSADYCRLAAWRTTDPAQRAAAMQVPKPPPVPDGQADLFSIGEVTP